MLNDPDHWFDQAVAALSATGPHKVWSVIVTLFGDLAQDPADQISGPLMSRIVEPLGIKPQAMRVALHRLRGEGWITSEKVGRTSLYRLTEKARAESAAATPRIYAPHPPEITDWQLAVTDPAVAGRGKLNGFVSVVPGVWLGSTGEVAPEGALVLQGDALAVPDWLKSRLCPKDTANAYETLGRALQTVENLLAAHPTPSPMQRATLRVLIVHHWRRILLGQPDIPASLLPDGWPGLAVRQQVAGLLASISMPGLQEMENALSGGAR